MGKSSNERVFSVHLPESTHRELALIKLDNPKKTMKELVIEAVELSLPALKEKYPRREAS